MEALHNEKFVFSISYANEEGLDDLSLRAPGPSALPPAPQPAAGATPHKWPVYTSSLSEACPAIDVSYVDKAESILEACVKPQPIQDMMRMVKQSNRTRFRKNIIRPLLEEGLLAMRIPTKPSSPLQTYFTTEKGKALL